MQRILRDATEEARQFAQENVALHLKRNCTVPYIYGAIPWSELGIRLTIFLVFDFWKAVHCI